MVFTPPPQIQLRNHLIDTAPLGRGIDAIGNALTRRRERENMAALGQAAQTGGLSALQNAAYGQGKIGMGMQAGNALLTNKLREAQIAKANQAPRGPKPTATMRHFQMAQQNPAFAKFLESRKPSTTNNVTIQHEKSFNKKMGEIHGKRMDEMQQSGAKARSTIGKLTAMEKALSDPNVFQGASGDWVQGVKKAAQAIGINVRGVENGEFAQRISNQIALGHKDDLPGPLSNSDLVFLRSLPPGLAKSAEGNRWLIALGRLDAQYKVDLASAARAYTKANGGILDAGFYSIQAEVAEKYQGQYGGLIEKLKSGTRATQAPITAGFPKISSREEYMRLNAGDRYIDPNGITRTKR